MSKYHIPITFILEIENNSEIIESDMIEDATQKFLNEFKKFTVEHQASKIKVIEPTVIIGKRAGYCL